MHTRGMTLMGPVFLQPPPTQQHVLRVKPKAARLHFGEREQLWSWQCHHKVTCARRMWNYLWSLVRWQLVVFYSGDWEENSLSAILAFSSLAADFRWDFFWISLLRSFWIIFQPGRLLHLCLLHWRARFPPCMGQVICHPLCTLQEIVLLVFRFLDPERISESGVSRRKRHISNMQLWCEHKIWQSFRSELGRGPNIPLLSDVCGRFASR